MEIYYFPYTAFDKYRCCRSKNIDDTFEFCIERRVTIFGFKFWIPIHSVDSDNEEMPKFKIGCINYPYIKIAELLNKI